MNCRVRYLIFMTLLIYITNTVSCEDICKICGSCGSMLVTCESKVLPRNAQVNSLVLTLINCNASLLFESQLSSSTLKGLLVKDTIIINIIENAFESLPNLSVVEISNSSLKQIYPETFSQSDELDIVDLSNNLLQDIPNTLFANRQKLRVIKLRGNNLTNIQRGTFMNNYQVKHLDVSRNKIQYLESGIFNISNVPKFTSDSRVILNIASNEIQLLNASVFSLCCHVTYLDLSNNKIKWIQKNAFSGLKSLQKLYLGFNKLNSLKADVFTPLVSLKEIDLQMNLFRNVVEYQFIRLPNVISIRLSGNKIEQLDPKAFSGLKFLKELHLDNNELNKLGSSFEELLPSLALVNMSVNHISSLEKDTFKGCTALRKMDLGDNSISLIEDYALYHLTQMVSLSLRRNSIVDLSCCSFAGLSSLKTLNLEQNVINVYNYSFIHSLTNLKRLYLSMNMDSKCECNLFAKLKEKNVDLILDSTVFNEECMKFNNIFLSKTIQFEEQCFNVSDFENVCPCPIALPSSTPLNDLADPPSDFTPHERSPSTNKRDFTSFTNSSSHSSKKLHIKYNSFSKFPDNAAVVFTNKTKPITSSINATSYSHSSATKSADQNFVAVPTTDSIVYVPVSSAGYEEEIHSNDNPVVRYVMYSCVFLSILTLTGVISMISYKAWLKCRWRNHVYEQVQMTECTPLGNSPV